MKQIFRVEGERITVEENSLDRVIRYLSPISGNRRFVARMKAAFSSSYRGASKRRNAGSGWQATGTDADSSTLFEVEELRDRSSDLIRNNAFALGAINTNVAHTIGTGLKLRPQIDHKLLGMSDDEADGWEESTEREFRFFYESVECDAARRMNGYQKQDLALRSALEKGDYFELMPEIPRAGSPYKLKLQGIEADRVTNPDNASDTLKLAGGIETDKHGAPLLYYIQTKHPGSIIEYSEAKWDSVQAFGKNTGRKNIIHLAKITRPGQRRSVPFLSPVMEDVKQFGRYQEAELMAAVVLGMVTTFLETDLNAPSQDNLGIIDTGQALESDGTMSMGNGSIVDLAPGQKANMANPGRPNTNFDPFILAILRNIGSALEMPYEVILKSYLSSFSASKAANNEMWKFTMNNRSWFSATYCQPIYENWMYEAVTMGRVTAPGFLSDAMTRKAYLGADWIGPAKGQIKEGEEVRAMQGRLSSMVSTIEEETIGISGRSFKRNIRQIAKERRILKDNGLILNQENEPTAQESAQLDAMEGANE